MNYINKTIKTYDIEKQTRRETQKLLLVVAPQTGFF